MRGRQNSLRQVVVWQEKRVTIRIYSLMILRVPGS
jgi:hypothetical protein